MIDITPDTMSNEILLHAYLVKMKFLSYRGYEIKEWLSTHRKVSVYAIVYDIDSFMPEQRSHLVVANTHYGITPEDADRIIAILYKKD